MEQAQPCVTPPLMLAGSSPSPKPAPETPPSPRNSPSQEQERAASPKHELSPSPEPNCAICLGKLQNKSFTDSCLHQFCFSCLLEWSKVKAECPLCKQYFKSIIHNVRSNEDYDQYHLRQTDMIMVQNPHLYMSNAWQSSDSSRFRYSTTLTAERRLERALQDLERDLQRRFEPGDIIPPQRTLPNRRGLQSVSHRKRLYATDMWIAHLPSFGARREMSPRHFRTHPGEVHRLIPWLNRELQAISRNPATSGRLLDLVVSELPVHDINSPQFRNAIEPYITEHYDHFIHEFQYFARSPYDMIGFDENAHYCRRSEVMMETEVIEISDSSESDVALLEEESRTHTATASSAVPGVSRVRTPLPVDQPSDSEVSSEPEGGVIDSADCTIVGYLKPRHERTPEIITLSDTDEDVNVSEVNDYTFSTTTTSCEDSGSEYVPPSPARKPRKKIQRKKKSTSASPRKKSSRKASSSYTKKRERSHSSSKDAECSCPRRQKSHCMSSSSSSSSSSDHDDHSYHKPYRKENKYDPPYSAGEVSAYLAGSSKSSRPKLRSIVITKNEDQGHSIRKVKKEPSIEPSTSRHRGSSHSSHREGSSSSSRQRLSKRKHKKDSNDRKSRTRKRKKILSVYSDSSDN